MKRQLIVGMISLGTINTAHAGVSAELMLANESSTLDTRFSGELAPRTMLYGRNRTTVDYENAVSTFFVGDIAYTLVGGLDAVAEVQAAPEMGIVPRLGTEYFTQQKAFSFFGELSAEVAGDPNAELTLRLTYAPTLGKEISGFGQLETITDVGLRGHEWSTERLRLGIGAHGYTVGGALDLVQVGNSIATTPTYGIFVAKKF
ncbi:hypothetical protein HZC31_01490 [Candidatus Woesearchaeota archaeon]|nr:hypothetical protein [Candidatus Woesearchaeota archaeon]